MAEIQALLDVQSSSTPFYCFCRCGQAQRCKDIQLRLKFSEVKLLNVVPLILLFLNPTSTKLLNSSDIQLPKSLVSDFGDILIGGLMPAHLQKSNNTLCEIHDPSFSYIRNRDGSIKCYKLHDSAVMWSEAIRFSVLASNQFLLNGTNITLGYDIRDSFNNVDVALDAALDFATLRKRPKMSNSLHKCECSENMSQPYVVALIGGARSEISQRVNTIVGVSSLPQISYSSTSVLLSDKTVYRTFLRTIPPDNFQVQAMVDIVKHYGWSYVAIAGTDEAYGRPGVEGFLAEARKNNICISTLRLFHFNISSDDSKKDIKYLVSELKADTKTNVIVLFCDSPRAVAVLTEAQKQGMTGKTWIATESWGLNKEIYDFDISTVGGVLGVVPSINRLDLFEKHLANLNPNATHNPWLIEYFRKKSCKVGDKDCKIDPSLNATTLQRNKASYVINAVYTVALSLLEYMKCGKTDGANCLRDIDLEKLKEYMLKVNTTGIDNRLINYDKHGNPGGSHYHISNLVSDPTAENGKRFVRVGSWSNGQLRITTPIYWNGGRNTTPVSRCSSPCPPGHGYVKGDVWCCWKCVLCPSGKFKIATGNQECDSCPQGFISDSNRTRCMRIPEEFIRWDSVTSVILLSLSLCGVLVTSFMFGVYFKYRNTPIVKASSRYPSLVLLVSIAIMFALPLIYIGRPNLALCHIQPISFGLLMTLASSLVLTKTFRLIQIFNNDMADLKDKALVTVKTQFFIVIVLVLFEVIVIAVFLDQRPIQVNVVVGDASVPIDCGASAKDLHTVVLLYNWFLALTCAVMAFRARSLPTNFSEARLISFAMFTFSVIWLAFLMVFTGSIISRFSTYMCVTILMTALDLVVCMFAPKIFVILFRPQLNDIHVVRKDIYRYSMKQINSRVRIHQMRSQRAELQRSSDTFQESIL